MKPNAILKKDEPTESGRIYLEYIVSRKIYPYKLTIMEEPNMQPQQPVQAAVEDLQKRHSRRSGRRERFFNTLKEKYPNFHTFYVFFNILAIWTGAFTIFESWAVGENLLEAPAP